MTTFDDTLRDLLAHPDEQVAHCRTQDRLMEEDRFTREGVLALVLANPEADGPRHVYARWCDAEADRLFFSKADVLAGSPLGARIESLIARAKFIRVQCELARLDQSASDTRWQFTRREELRRRERELWVIVRDSMLGSVLPAINSLGLEQYASETVGSLRCAVVRRGFIESVTCTAEDWLTHADAIRREHPVTKVALTTIPTGTDFQNRKTFASPGDWLRWVRANADSTIAELLADEFPGIIFTLPCNEHGQWTIGNFDPLFPMG